MVNKLSVMIIASLLVLGLIESSAAATKPSIPIIKI